MTPWASRVRSNTNRWSMTGRYAPVSTISRKKAASSDRSAAALFITRTDQVSVHQIA